MLSINHLPNVLDILLWSLVQKAHAFIFIFEIVLKIKKILISSRKSLFINHLINVLDKYTVMVACSERIFLNFHV